MEDHEALLPMHSACGRQDVHVNVEDNVCLAPLLKGVRVVDSKMTKRSKAFHTKQNENIQKLIHLHEGTPMDEETESVGHFSCFRTSEQASKWSLAVNIMLLILKAVAAKSSGSLAIISTLIESSLDLFSGTVFYLVGRNASKRDVRYPIGKTRMEPLAVVFVASVMGTAALEVALVSIQDIVNGPEMPSITATSIGIVAAVIGSKGILYFMCRSLGTSTSQALATDHLNDVISNAVVMAAVLLAHHVTVYADNVGAIIISMFIISAWWRQGIHHVRALSGKASSPELVQQVTWLALHHDINILAVDTVRTYSVGAGFFVECDIVLNRNTPLHRSHDIGESLQVRLERLEDVERVFVHLDYSSDHSAADEHRDLYADGPGAAPSHVRCGSVSSADETNVDAALEAADQQLVNPVPSDRLFSPVAGDATPSHETSAVNQASASASGSASTSAQPKPAAAAEDDNDDDYDKDD